APGPLMGGPWHRLRPAATNRGRRALLRRSKVAYVLEGSVRKAGDEVRITAQLIDAASGYHQWSAHYDRELKDVFAVQDEISRAIVAELRLQLSDARAGSVLARTETANPEAHTLLLRGIAARRTDLPAGVIESIALLRQALGIDPAYGRAHAELASSLGRAGYMRYLPYPASYDQARSEARRALALDSTLAEAHAVLGQVAEYRDWDWAAAERHYRNALAYNPNHAQAHAALSMLLVRLGNAEAGMAEAERAVAIDPLSAPTLNNLGNVYLNSGRFPDALRCCRDGLALQPQSVALLVNSALAYSFMDRHADALRAISAVDTLTTGVEWVPGMVGLVQARAGHRQEAERALQKLRATPGVSPYLAAMVHAALGRPDSALALLGRAVALRDDFVPDLAVDPSFAMLRSDARMRRLLRTAGLGH
ncbi:MAG: tetratricopeptide repeat protein, partial [Gemmatimonadetes bacterium]|nr:tetratricopeptide repeat protein [Gemmatimonadota bacterium]